MCSFFFFQAEDGIRDIGVTGVQTCALPISHFRHAGLTLIVADARDGAIEYQHAVVNERDVTWTGESSVAAGRRVLDDVECLPVIRRARNVDDRLGHSVEGAVRTDLLREIAKASRGST